MKGEQMSTLEQRKAEIEERRAARNALVTSSEEEQYVNDLEAVDAIEAERGPRNVAVLRVNYVEGLPVLVAVRAPTEHEVKRYRARVKSEDKDQAIAGAAEIGDCCVVYPTKEQFAKLLKARPNLAVDCGTQALKLVVARSDSEGKG